ncbi:MAG: hypothetical protein R2777_00820 [Chitinophagales bacterium]
MEFTNWSANALTSKIKNTTYHHARTTLVTEVSKVKPNAVAVTLILLS